MIGIVHVGNILAEPYFEKYKSAMDKSGENYELILWDRRGEVQSQDGIHVFRCGNIPKGKLGKYLAYRKFSKFAKKIVKEKKYEKLVLLTTLSAFVLGKTIKEYKGKYVLDIRDMSFEKSPVFRKKLSRIIKNSTFTAISSSGFLDVLPDYEYTLVHNLSGEDGEIDFKPKQEDGKIEVLYTGNSRGFEFNKRLIQIFGKDDRFHLTIAGEGVDEPKLIDLAKSSGVTVCGKYDSKKKRELLLGADMIINMNTASFNGKRLTANKFYDGLLYKLPQVARVDEYTGALVTCKELGVALDFWDGDFADKLYEYYQNMDIEEFTRKADAELKRAKQQNEVFVEKIVEFAKSK